MGRTRAVAALLLLLASGCAGSAGSSAPTISPTQLSVPSAGAQARGTITHVIVIVQENRTFDNIFGGYAGGPQPFPGADSTIPNTGLIFTPSTFATRAPHNAHDWYRCLQVNSFAAITWEDYATGTWPHGPQPCPTAPPPANPNTGAGAEPEALTVVDDLHRLTYWSIAQNYELGDNYYAIQDADSFSGHQYIVALQSVNDAGQVIAGTPQQGTNLSLNCGTTVATDDVQTPVLNFSNGFTAWQLEGDSGACWGGTTFADRLNATRPATSWTHYSTDPRSGVFDGFVNFRAWYPQTMGLPGGHFRHALADLPADIAARTIPQFAWVKPPCVALSDHPGETHDPYGGQSWVATIVNAIGNDPALWQHTVIFVVWDDWGGFYDHAIPAQPGINPIGALTPGMRQPFLVVSAYGRGRGRVSHSSASYASVMKFAEDLYGIAPLNALDATANDLSDFFDFSKKPDTFTPVTITESNFDATRACSQYIGIFASEIDR